MKTKGKSSAEEESPHPEINELQFLAGASLRINQMETGDEVAEFVCGQIKTLVGTGYVCVTLLDEITQTLSIRSFKGLEDDNLINTGLRLIGSDPRKLKVPIKDFTADDLAIYNSGRLEFLDDGLNTLMVRKYPRQICDIIARLLNIRSVYTMGFVFHNRHIGSIAILADAESVVEPNRLVIENIVAQAAAILVRIRTEAALQESTEKYRILLEQSPDPVFSFTPEGVYTYANQALSDVYGIPVNQIVGKTLWDFFPESEADRRFAALQEALRTGKETIVEGPVAGKNGIRYYVTTVSPVFDSQGKALLGVCSSKNITERKQVEESIKTANNLLKEAERIGKAGGWELNIETGQQIWTEETARIHEVEPDFQPTIENGINFYSPTSVPVIRQAVRQLIDDGKSFDLELELITAKGNARKVRAIGHPDLAHRRVYGFFQDITEQKTIEEELRESQEQYRTLIDNANEAIVVAQDGELKYVNRTSLEMFAGYTEHELLNMPFTNFIHPDDRARIIDNFQKRLRNEPMATRNEYRIIMPDGIVKYAEIGTTLIEWKNKPATLNFISDITDRKKAEADLLESQTQQKAIVDSTSDMIWSVEPEKFGLLTFNRGFSEFFLRERGIIVHKGMTPEVLFPNDQYITAWLGFYRRALTEGSFSSEFVPYATKITMQLTLNVLKRDNKIFGISVFAKDISELRRAEETKKLMEEKAQAANRLTAVGEMAAGIAHEINNPLTSVIGFSKWVLEDHTISEEMKEDLIVVAESSQRIANIVKGLLTFARQSKPLKTSVNLNELIDNTLKLREYVLKTNKIIVVTMYDEQLPWIVVDPAQMQQVFLNLIVNAEQAMKKAHGMGTLTITTEKKENIILISFQDDGPGISNENMGRLFEPFFTTKEPGEGTGLGLSISRSIVLEHNGKLTVDSKEGYGATFTIEIPIVEEQPVVTENPVSKPVVKTQETRKGRILVVDDEPGIRALLETRLTKMGHSVDAIGDAASAVEMVNAGTHYDVIVTDVRMPGMSGIELYSLIVRKMPETKKGFIFITGDVMGADIKAFMHQHHLTAFPKPFETKALMEKIESILGAGQLQS